MKTISKLSESPTAEEHHSGPRSPIWMPWALGAIAVVLLAAAALAWNGGSDSAPGSGGPVVELSLGESEGLASCLAFDVAILADMPMAFLGRVEAVEGSRITLDVDRWYRGGDADAVTLIGEHRSTALIAGFDPVPGETYLISASGGSVNYCGYSGQANADLLAAYEAAFPTR